MKKLLVSTLIASGLVISGASSFALEEQPKDAQTEQHMQEGAEHGANTSTTEVRGEVTNVQDKTVEIKDETGKTHSFDTTNLQNLEELEAESIKPGDSVIVKIDSGKAILIEKVEAKSDASSENSSTTTAANSLDDESMKRDDNAMPEEALEGKEQPETASEGEYVVKQGDTLGDIAEEQLGSKEEWKLIARANNIDNPDKIYVGQRLSIPSNTNSGSQELNQEQAPNSDENEPMKDNTENAPASENY
ncbi:MAG: LysM peptidoglycan-binding domain-containing protein [Thermodesulfobacteriota bacterium]